MTGDETQTETQHPGPSKTPQTSRVAHHKRRQDLSLRWPYTALLYLTHYHSPPSPFVHPSPSPASPLTLFNTMIAAITRVLLFSVLSSSTHLPLALLSHVFLASSVAQTPDLKSSDTAPDLIRALPTDLSTSGCVGYPGYTFSPTAPPLSPSISPPQPTSLPVLTSTLSSVLINLQMVRVTHVLLTPLPSVASSTYHSTSSGAPQGASKGVQASSRRGDEVASQINDNSLFRPHLPLTTPSSQGPVLAAGSGPSTDHDTPPSSLRDSVTPSYTPDVGNETSDNDLHEIILFGLNTRTEKESNREFQARESGAVSAKLNQNFLNSGRLLAGAESDNSLKSHKVKRTQNFRTGSQTKVPGRHLSLRQRGRCQSSQLSGECMGRKTRFGHDNLVRETQVTYAGILGEEKVPEAPKHNEERRTRQRKGSLTLEGDGKARRKGRSRERRVTHLASLALLRGQGGEGKSSEGTQGNYQEETSLGHKKSERTSVSRHNGRHVKMFVSLTDSRAPSNTVDRRRKEVRSSSSSGSPKKEANEKWPTEQENKFRAAIRDSKWERLFDSQTVGDETGGDARLPEIQQTRRQEDFPDASLHVLHVSPFIPDLILDDDGLPQNPYLDEPPDSSPSSAPLTPTGAGDHSLQANDSVTPTPAPFASPARIRVIKEDLDEGNGGGGGRARQWEAENSSWLTSEATAEQKDEKGLLLNVLPFRAHGENDNESQPQLYETNANVSEEEAHEQQSSLLLPSLLNKKAVEGRNVQREGSNVTKPTSKRRATTRAPDIPLLDTEGSVRIPCYVVIFLLGVIGNTLVIVTLLQNRKMRTITNVFLLNLVSE